MQTRIDFNIDGLNELVNQLGSEYVARVGILENKATSPHADSELTNGEIGVVHELGSETRNIPPRSFLRLPVETKGKEIMSAMGGKTIQAAIEAKQYKTAYALLGVVAEGYVKQSFATSGYGQWAALKPATVKAKGSSRPLIDTGQLRRSVTSDVIKRSDLNG